jgi:hypothetical protein
MKENLARAENDNAAGGATRPAEVRFQLGRTLITPGAEDALQEAGDDGRGYLRRHAAGDWGIVGAEDREENELSVREGFRILSAYLTGKGVKIWIITEADRSATTILLPEEY